MQKPRKIILREYIKKKNTTRVSQNNSVKNNTFSEEMYCLIYLELFTLPVLKCQLFYHQSVH